MKIKLIMISIILLLVMVFASGCIPVLEKLGLVNPTNEEQLSPEKGGPPDGLVKVLIGFKEKPGPAEQALVKGLGGKIKYTYNLIPAIAASVPEVAIEALKKNPNITDVELDSMVYALDTELENSWGVKRIGAGNVHDPLVPISNGFGVKVAIIDTGIDYKHPDLDDNYYGGWDFVNNGGDPMDDNGHGTHVAGIIAAEDNDEGVVGVAPEAELYALKVLDATGSGYVSDVIFAIQWATDPDGDGSANDRLDIINMSLGADRGNIFFKWACNLAYDDGLLLVAAAGNDYGGAVDYPAAYDSVIAVSATGSNDELAYFSSTGKQVELAAPGVSINSTLLGEGYGEKSGTSMASPHVAGTAALVWAMDDSLTNDDVRTQLQNTAEDISLLSTEQGYGLVDADEAVPQSTDTTPPAKVTGLIITTVSYAQLDLAWNANTEEDLNYYNVYRSTTFGGPYDLVSSPTMNSYSDVGLTASTTYYYMVTAVDNSGNEGDASDEASGTTNVDDLGPVTSDVVTDPKPTNGATSVTLTADVSDATTGNSNVTAVEYFVNTVGKDGLGTSMSASDGAFDSSTEGVTASIGVSGWAVGQYTLYVHGLDAAGNWGATESVMLEVTEAPSNIIMHVESIIFSVEKVRKKLTLSTEVEILLKENTTAVDGATVSMTLTYRRRSWDFTGNTDSEGIVKFTLPNAKTGNYTATVTNVLYTGYSWDDVETTESCLLNKDGTVK